MDHVMGGVLREAISRVEKRGEGRGRARGGHPSNGEHSRMEHCWSGHESRDIDHRRKPYFREIYPRLLLLESTYFSFPVTSLSPAGLPAAYFTSR
jgi:hypothetical protein